jgi:hypothetical protein
MVKTTSMRFRGGTYYFYWSWMEAASMWTLIGQEWVE